MSLLDEILVEGSDNYKVVGGVLSKRGRAASLTIRLSGEESEVLEELFPDRLDVWKKVTVDMSASVSAKKSGNQTVLVLRLR